MVYNILGSEPIHRIDVNFNVQTKNLDSFIGRTAHINLIIQQSLFKITNATIPDLFDIRKVWVCLFIKLIFTIYYVWNNWQIKHTINIKSRQKYADLTLKLDRSGYVGYLGSCRTSLHLVSFLGMEPKVLVFYVGIPCPSRLLWTIYEFLLNLHSELLKYYITYTDSVFYIGV